MSPEARAIRDAIHELVRAHVPAPDRNPYARDAIALLDALNAVAYAANWSETRDGVACLPHSAITLAYWEEWVEAMDVPAPDRGEYLAWIDGLERDFHKAMPETFPAHWMTDEPETERPAL